MEVAVSANGDVRMVFDDRFDARLLGKTKIKRGSHVEPTSDGLWTADLSPVDGPVLGPYESRTEALAAEVSWLNKNWLAKS